MKHRTCSKVKPKFWTHSLKAVGRFKVVLVKWQSYSDIRVGVDCNHRSAFSRSSELKILSRMRKLLKLKTINRYKIFGISQVVSKSNRCKFYIKI